MTKYMLKLSKVFGIIILFAGCEDEGAEVKFEFAANYPAISSIKQHTATLSIKVNKECKLFYIVQESLEKEPDNLQVKDGKTGTNQVAFSHGFVRSVN